MILLSAIADICGEIRSLLASEVLQAWSKEVLALLHWTPWNAEHLIVPQTKEKRFHLMLEIKICDTLKTCPNGSLIVNGKNSGSLPLCLSSDLSDGCSTAIHTNPYYPSVLSFGMNWHFQCRKLPSKSSTVLLQYFVIQRNQSNWWFTLFTLFSFKKMAILPLEYLCKIFFFLSVIALKCFINFNSQIPK